MAVRITQAEVDSAELPTSAAVRFSQAELDSGQLPSSAQVRLTQIELDVAIGALAGQPFEEHGFMIVADRWM